MACLDEAIADMTELASKLAAAASGRLGPSRRVTRGQGPQLGRRRRRGTTSRA